MASYANLIVDQGADFETTVVLEDESSDPIDLTGYALTGQIRRTYKSSTATNFTLANQGMPTNGVILLRLPGSVSAAMKSGRYVYDVYANNSVQNKTYKVLEGMLEIVPSVTRSGA